MLSTTPMCIVSFPLGTDIDENATYPIASRKIMTEAIPTALSSMKYRDIRLTGFMLNNSFIMKNGALYHLGPLSLAMASPASQKYQENQ